MISSLANAALALSQSAELSLLSKATALIGLGLLLTRMAVHTRAAMRHLLLVATFAAVLALPLAASVVPEIAIGIPVVFASATPRPATATPVPAEAPSLRSGAGDVNAGRTRPISWATVIRAGWIAGTALCLVPLALVLWRLGRLRRTGLPWPELRGAVRWLAADTGVGRPVDVLLHEDVPSPLTFGTRRPVIVLPPDARAWDEADLRRALVHELEHVKRGDWAVQVAARAIAAVYWFHPLIWLAWRRLSLEAERACDDAVVAREEGAEYAEQLVSLAERLSAAHAQPTLGMANRSDLSERVAALLDTSQRRGRAGIGAVAGATAIAALVVTVVAPLRAVAMASAPPLRVEALEASEDRAPSIGGDERRQRAIDRALYEAAESGDIDGVEELLQAGANVDAAIDGDGSPLIGAVRSGRAAAVKHLLDRGANPNLGVEGDGSPLIAAAAGGNLAMVALLLDRGADIEQVVPGDENPLIQASGAGHLDVVRLLVERGANVNARVWVETFRGGGEWRSPLSMARRGRHAQVVAFLLSAGAAD